MSRSWISDGRRRRPRAGEAAGDRGVDRPDLDRRSGDQACRRLDERERLERFRLAVRESAGAAPEIGSAVEDLRQADLARSAELQW